MDSVKELLGKNKLLRIAVAVVAVILIFSIFSALFGNKAVKNAEKEIKKELVALMEGEGFSGVKVKTSVIGKNKSADLYCFDVTVSGKYLGEKFEYSSFMIIYSDGEDIFTYGEYEYEKSNKKDVKEVALAALSRG